MTDAIVDQLADAIVGDLNAQTFSKSCTFEANDYPEILIDALSRDSGVVGYVVPEAWNEGTELSRARLGVDEYGLWIVIAKKLENDSNDDRAVGSDQTERRALRYFVQEVRQRLRGRRLTCADGDTALWRRAGTSSSNANDPWPLMAKQRIAKPGIFLSGTYVVYAV